MQTSGRSAHHVVVPDEDTSAEAAHAAHTVKVFLEQHPEASTVRLSLGGDDGVGCEIPADVLGLLARVLARSAAGDAVAVSTVKAELTTQQAADLLNVSRPYVVKLLDQRRIPFRRVGNRRRLLLSDVVAFQHADEAERRAIAAELTAEVQGGDLDVLTPATRPMA